MTIRANAQAGEQPLATAIIFGLTAAVPLVVLFLPRLLLLLPKAGRAA